jgi:hypothetical protein
VGVDIASLVLAIDSTQVEKGSSALDTLTSASGRAEQSSLILAKAGAAAGIAIAAVAAAALNMARNAINAADAMNDLHLKTGLAFKDLAAYDLLANQSGSSIQGIAQGFKFLGKSMTDNRAELVALGVTSKDTNVAMGQFADLISSINDPALRTTVAMKYLGRAGVELIPTLMGGSAAIVEARRQTEAYGKQLEKAAPAADKFNDNLAVLKSRSSILGMTLANELLSRLNLIVDAMVTASEKSGTLAAVGAGTAGLFKQVFNPLLALALQVGASFTEATISFNKFMAGITAGNAKSTFLATAATEAQNLARQYKQIADLDVSGASAANVAASAVKKLTAAQEEAIRTAEERAKAAKEAAKAYATLQKAADDFVTSLKKEAQTFGMSDSAKKSYEATTISLTLNKGKERDAFIASAQAYIAEKQALEDAAAAVRIHNDLVSQFIEDEEKAQDKIRDGIRQIREHAAALEDDTARMALSGKQLQDHIVLREMEKSGLEKSSTAYAQMESRYRSALSANEMAKQAKAGAEASAKAWNKFADDVERALTDALMRGFESGKSFGQNFIDSLKNMLKTSALKITVQAIVDPIMGSVNSIMGGAGSSSMNLLNNGISSIGFGAVQQGINTAAYSTLGAMGTEQAAMLAAQDSVFGMAGTSATLEAAGASMASSFAAALPWLGGALAVGSMLGMFEGDGPAQRTGQFVAPLGQSDAAGASQFGAMPDGSRYNWANNHWFSGDMAPAQDAFDASLQASEKSVIDKLGLSAAQIAAVNAQLDAISGKSYNFGTEHTDVASSGAFEAIQADRMNAIAASLGMSLKDLQDQMSGAAKTAKELAAETKAQAGAAKQAAASGILANIGATLSALDAVTGLRSGIMSSIASIKGGNTYASRMSGLQELLAGETGISRQIDLTGQMKDLVLDRYQTERSAIESNQAAAVQAADALRAGLRSVGDYAKSLLVGNLSPLTNKQRLDEAGSQYQALLGRAQDGDVGAVGSISGAASTYLEQARAYSPGGYSATFSGVQSALAAMGLSADSVSAVGNWQEQLLATDTQATDALNGLVGVTENWTLNLENLLIDQTKQFEALNVKMGDVAGNTKDLDKRITVLLDAALGTRLDKLSAAVEKSATTTARAVTNAVQIVVRA